MLLFLNKSYCWHPPTATERPLSKICPECSFRLSRTMARRTCRFVVVPVFCTPLTRNRRFADAVPDPEHFNFHFFKDLPSEIAGFGFQLCHLALPVRAFFLTSHAIAQFLYRVSSPLFVALSTGCLAPSWGLLGAVLGHLGGRLGSILGHLGAVLLLFSIQRAATQVVLPKSPSR